MTKENPTVRLSSVARVVESVEICKEEVHVFAIRLNFFPDPLGHVFLAILDERKSGCKSFLEQMMRDLGKPLDIHLAEECNPWLQRPGVRHYFWKLEDPPATPQCNS